MTPAQRIIAAIQEDAGTPETDDLRERIARRIEMASAADFLYGGVSAAAAIAYGVAAHIARTTP